MFQSAAATAAKATGAALVGGAGYGAYLSQTDEGTSRMIKAYSQFCPLVMQYRLLEAKQKFLPEGTVTDQDWANLDETYAKPTIGRLGELQGMYCKYGQIAAGLSNTLSDVWIKELRRLESDVPPRSVDVVYQTIQEELGAPVDEIFESFDPEPLGSASIGQVHRARLKGDGRDVAVKVQYPEASQMFRDDMKTIRSFCEWLAPENIVSLSALEEQNATELDYRIEASNLKEVAANMKALGFLPKEVVVPQPIGELSTKRLLVMELIPGPKLNDGVRSYFSQWALANGTTLEKLETEAKRKMEKEGIPAKYDGPSAAQIDRYKRLLQLKDGALNIGIAVFNGTVGRLPNTKRKEYKHTSVPLNLPRLMDILMRVHGYQLMKDGCFNADPHGGNFLLLPGGSRIGLIDYGATKRLTRNERLAACLIYAALHRNDDDMLWNVSIIGGYKSKYNRKDVLMKLMRFSYDSWGVDVMEGKNIQQFIDELKAIDPWEEVADNLILASFMSIRLRSLALGMNHPVRCSDWWGPIAEEILKEEGLPYESWDHEQLVRYKVEGNIQKYKF